MDLSLSLSLCLSVYTHTVNNCQVWAVCCSGLHCSSFWMMPSVLSRPIRWGRHARLPPSDPRLLQVDLSFWGTWPEELRHAEVRELTGWSRVARSSVTRRPGRRDVNIQRKAERHTFGPHRVCYYCDVPSSYCMCQQVWGTRESEGRT